MQSEFLSVAARRAQQHADSSCQGSQRCELCYKCQQWKEADPHRPRLTAASRFQGFGDVDLDFQTTTAPPAGPRGSAQAASYAAARCIESEEADLAETDTILAEPSIAARALAFATPVQAPRVRSAPDSSNTVNDENSRSDMSNS
jgi:hypothetical protein